MTEPTAPAAMMPHGFGFHLMMMKARIVHAGGANTGMVSTIRAAANAAKNSTTFELYAGDLPRRLQRVVDAHQTPVDALGKRWPLDQLQHHRVDVRAPFGT